MQAKGDKLYGYILTMIYPILNEVEIPVVSSQDTDFTFLIGKRKVSCTL